jgi:hypothetical protein
MLLGTGVQEQKQMAPGFELEMPLADGNRRCVQF